MSSGREIKFRGMDSEGEWHYGYLIVRKHDGFLRTYIYDSTYDETEIEGHDDYDTKVKLKDLFISVIPETVGQLTGKKDKNGKEIWEGDIIKRIWNPKNIFIGVVKFGEHMANGDDYYSNLAWGFYVDGGETDNLISHKEYEVIGNISENPELLK